MAVMLLMWGMMAMAQTSMTAAVERYLIASNRVASMSEKMETTLVTLTPQLQLRVPSGYTAESMAQKYIESEFTKDVASLFSPYFVNDGVTIAEVNEVSEKFETPEGQLASKHEAKMGAQENLVDMMAIVQNGVLSIVQGKMPEKVKSTASAERKALFSAYYKNNNMDAFVSVAIAQMFAGKDVPQDMKIKMEKYFKENMETLMLNVSESILTDADLTFLGNLYAMPQYSKISESAIKVMNNPQEFGMGIIMKYKLWVDKLK